MNIPLAALLLAAITPTTDDASIVGVPANPPTDPPMPDPLLPPADYRREVYGPLWTPDRPYSTTDPRDPKAHTCPRCGAAPGEECRRDRGRYPFHMARVALTREVMR
jgi:hypothetical protein